MIENYDEIIKYIAWLSPIMLALVIYLKTGSTHIIFMRLWQMFSPQEYKDETLRSYHEKCMDIYNFRFSNIIKVERIDEIQKIIEWIEEYNLPPKRIAQAGYLITPNGNEILKKQSKWWLIYFSSLIIGSYFSIYLTSILITKDAALLRVIKTDTHYWVTNDKIERIWSNESFEFIGCSKNKTVVSSKSISTEDIDVFCKYNDTKNKEQLLNSTINSQRKTGFFLILIQAFALLFSIKRIRSLHAADYILRKIKESQSSGPDVTQISTSTNPS
jgi:hypothetical protein